MTPERKAEIRARLDVLQADPLRIFDPTVNDLRDLLAALDEREQQIAAVRAMLTQRLALSEEVLGSMGAVPFVIPIQDVLTVLNAASELRVDG